MFRYDAGWLASPRRFPVAPTMPLSPAPFYASSSREDRRTALLSIRAVLHRRRDRYRRVLHRHRGRAEGARAGPGRADDGALPADVVHDPGVQQRRPPEAAPFFDLEADVALDMLSRMVSIIDARWRTHCRAAGMTAQETALYEPAFDHEESRVARRFVGRCG